MCWSQKKHSIRRALHRWATTSLRRTLLLTLLPGLILVMGLEVTVSWRNDLASANAAFDRSLLGAVKAMDANLNTSHGGLSVELPYQLLEFFELTASGQVFFRVATGDGLVEIGNAGLPLPPQPLVDGIAQFHDARYFGYPVRISSYQRRLARPLSQGSHSDHVIIQVAETLESRQDFIHRLVLESVARNTLLLLAALALVLLAIDGALHPLHRLHRDMLGRSQHDLTPIAPGQVPHEVQPLVGAINTHMQRYQHAVQQQRQFIDDASHQLRTPLATLSTQIAYTLRERNPQQRDTALQAMRQQVDEAIHQTNQMLALARADALPLTPIELDLFSLAETVTRRLWPLARQHGHDLGLEPVHADTGTPAQPRSNHAWGHAALLEEALSNLIANALTYVPPGGHITVQAGVVPSPHGPQARLCVIDDGPGLHASDQARVGERFLRIHPAPNTPNPADTTPRGSGLGLAIAQAIVQRHHGHLQVHDSDPNRPNSPGLTVCLNWPAKLAKANA